ncbi:hypothetical protein OTK49_01360 [Vibrio coralliirubri]|uniref:hypothetical protein n=1 Tax=Vibrio coralliirubri TaxID=1516159 RepID=UPI002284B41C|nr:hypothetical protein [Vibrio coralliirubri]MCY9861177.1 hypothetical protein [Vibrio coralliirubri]
MFSLICLSQNGVIALLKINKTMLSINQIIEANEKTGDSPYFLIDSNQLGFSSRAFVANSIKRSDLMTPNEASRVCIQQLTNLACHVNLMEISLDLTSVYEGVFKFRKSLVVAKVINSVLGRFDSLNQKALQSVVNYSGLDSVNEGVREAATMLLKIEDHLDEMHQLITDQIVKIEQLADKYKVDSNERKILCNTIISKVIAGESLKDESADVALANDVKTMDEFVKHLEIFAKMYHEFYAGLIVQIEQARASIKEIAVNFESTIDVIDDCASSPVKSLGVLPTESFEADISTLIRKSMSGESPLIVLASVLEKHIIFISEANSALIDVANSIDRQVNYFAEEIRTVIQPHVTCDLVKVSNESMLNTQRRYEYNPEN